MLNRGTSIGVRGFTSIARTHAGQVAKKKKSGGDSDGKLDRVERHEGQSALFEYETPEEEEAPELPAEIAIVGDAFRGAPVFSDVDQGNLGDAWLLASFAAVAHAEPQALTRAIEKHDEKTWMVRVGKDAIVVGADFPSEGYADPLPNNQKDTLWVAL